MGRGKGIDLQVISSPKSKDYRLNVKENIENQLYVYSTLLNHRITDPISVTCN